MVVVVMMMVTEGGGCDGDSDIEDFLPGRDGLVTPKSSVVMCNRLCFLCLLTIHHSSACTSSPPSP